MAPNEDFSFVRFLKVIKTLYESCTFTQLGRTVGSALTYGNNATRGISEEEDESEVEDSNAPKVAQLSLVDESQITINGQADVSGGGLLGFFCGSPIADDLTVTPSDIRKPRKEQLSFDGRHLSLFEQMITCTLGHDVGAYEIDDASIESYLKANETVSYSDREGGETTDESFEDDDSDFRHGRGRRPRNSARRHRK